MRKLLQGMLGGAVIMAVGGLPRARVIAAETPALAQNPAAVEQMPQRNPQLLYEPNTALGEYLVGAKFSSDNDVIVIYGVDWGDPNKPNRKRLGKIELWDVRQHRRIREFQGHSDLVQRVDVSPDGNLLASQSQDGMVVLWNRATGARVSTLYPAMPRAEFGPKMTLDDFRRTLERPTLLGFSDAGRSVVVLKPEAELPPIKQETATQKKVNAPETKPIRLKYTIESWDVATGHKAHTIKLPSFALSERIGGFSVTPDGKFLISIANLAVDEKLSDAKTGTTAALGNRIDIYRMEDGSLGKTIELPPGARYSGFGALSPDNHMLAVIETRKSADGVEAKKRLVLVDLNAGRLQGTWECEADRVAFASDGTEIAVEGRAGSIEIRDIKDGRVERTLSGGHPDDIGTINFSSDGKAMVSVGESDSYVQVWNLAAPLSQIPGRALVRTGNVRALDFDKEGFIWDAEFGTQYSSPEKGSLDQGTGLDILKIEAASGAVKRVRIPNKCLIDSSVFSHDHKLVAAGLSRQTKPAFAEGAGFGVWDIETKKSLFIAPPELYVRDVLAFSPDDAILAVDTPALWNVKTGKLLRPLEPSDSSIEAGIFSADGRYFIAGTEGGSILFYDVATGKIVRRVTEDASVNKLIFSPDGALLASAGPVKVNYQPIGTNVRLWEMSSGTILQQFPLEGRLFGGLAFSADGKWLAIASFVETNFRRTDSRIDLWNLETYKQAATLRDIGGLERPLFSADGRYLLASGFSWLKVWEMSALVNKP